MNDDKKRSLLKNPLTYGFGLTALLIGAVLVLAFQPHCIQNSNLTLSCVPKYQRFLNSSPNEIGDTLAGIASTLAFLWIIITVWLQSLELAAQRKEMARATLATEKTSAALDKQLFETTFFSILSTLNDIINSIDLVDVKNGKVTSGRDCFRIFYTRFNKKYEKSSAKSENVRIQHSYQQFWRTHEAELAHYFRFLYRAFKILAENKHAQEYHAKLLRSQLSEHELLVLFYNILTTQGQKFEELAVKFELFDNLPSYKLLDSSHKDLIDERSYGDNDMSKPAPLHRLEKAVGR